MPRHAVEPLPPVVSPATDRVVWWLPVALMLALLVALPLLRTGEATGGTQMNLDRTVFTAVDAVTMTGFRLTYVNPNDFKPLGQAILFVLMSGGTLVTWIFSGFAIARTAQMPFSLWQIVRAALTTYAMSIIVAANLLMTSSNDLWEAIYQSASAIGNFGGAIGVLPAAEHWTAQVVMLPLALLGSLSIPVILDLLAAGFAWRRLHGYSRLVLLCTAATYVLGLLLMAWTYWMPGIEPSRTLIVASTESLNTRSLGMPLVALRELPRASVWVSMALMVVGGNPGGATGGVTTVGLVLLLHETLRLLRGRPVSRVAGYLVAWIGVYFLAIFILVLVLLHNEPQLPGDEALYLTLSALGTVGRSSEPLTGVGVGLHVLSIGMLIGRFFPMLMLWRIQQAAAANPSLVRTDFAH
jgi:Trk-type K+ transport system membrane component